MDIYVERSIFRVTGKDRELLCDPIAIEKKLVLRINGAEVLAMYCSPVMVKELVTGFIMTEGIIRGSWCVDKMAIKYNDDIEVDIDATGEVVLEGKAVTSGCIGGITTKKTFGEKLSTDNFKVDGDSVRRLFNEFQHRSASYNLTGCIHSAAISDGNEILVMTEDIGRHNAVDKAIGHCIINDIALDDKLMLLSGRLSSEIGSKCGKWSIPVVASRTAPTLLSVEIADSLGITMIGFIRGNRFNIYTHPQRIS
ncbi:MAG: formate dehydrogenase accessory sulfurtransferase FdhD [Nitrospirae bacterium]|nr:formate dehydrogenase accessory sulfurtransferase FdhD [Nitrospirota bacterium]MBF0536331.1 formate dehydrogenase accessory sulfurtransferase FdhD [Nitrospirota bacterium]MBF0618272.1 formate dehydrogenase accessory sulfurtransferase FdhD [Nitrospirota bacterium]